MERHSDYLEYRKKYPVFNYNAYEITQNEAEIIISYDFSIDNLCRFNPSIKIKTGNLDIINKINSDTAKKIVFSLGMTEAVSYLKAACPPKMLVKCGDLDESAKGFWLKLYTNGLGEFFHVNSINPGGDFLTIECAEPSLSGNLPEAFAGSGKNIIPVGGGKDSAVTIELLRDFYDSNLFFTINDQEARTQTVTAAGYSEARIIKTYRTIAPELLELNKRGFLNGHTPFSAVVAFLSLYCAYITGARNIVLSNESSANEPSVRGSGVNHQYSKSYEFENDFRKYLRENITGEINYFSLLRSFSEFNIAKMFASYSKYHDIFRSCNLGGKNNNWCRECGKCLFIYSILSPFIPSGRLNAIFGADMLDKRALLDDFRGLTGFVPVKPFECVGTVDEIRYALSLTAKQYMESGEKLPFLLEFFTQNANIKKILNENHAFLEYNNENNVPQNFLNAIRPYLNSSPP